MAIVKVTNVFRQQTTATGRPYAGRVGGWTESWYFTGNTRDAHTANTKVGGLCATRANLLSVSGAIIGQRYQVVDPLPVGASISRAAEFSGRTGAANLGDIPQMSLLLTLVGVGVTNQRKHIVRGIPDDYVKAGEFNPTASYSRALDTYLLALSYYKFRCHERGLPRYAVTSVSMAAGLATFGEDHAFIVGDTVQLSGLIVSSGFDLAPKKFVVKVLTVPGTTSIQFAITPGGLAYVGGKATKLVVLYPVISGADATVGRIITRKVGRPFGQYVGRR